jgi:asparagine synthase (glutamine-hydrolysing)
MMGGIGGYVGIDGTTGEMVLRRMSGTQGRTGPNGAGFFQGVGVGLTHHRLAVIGPRLEQQPMRSDDGRFVLSFRGEVFNCRELRADLAGHGFASTGDIEVVLAAWTQWQEKALARFDGVFALAVADTLTGTVTLARDPSGTHPLYLAELGHGRILFATELRALLATGLLRRGERSSLLRHLRARFQPDGTSFIYPEVRLIFPGQLAIMADGVVAYRDFPVPLDPPVKLAG